MDGKEGGREMLPSGDSIAHDAHTSVKQSKLQICKETLYIAGGSVRLDGPVKGAGAPLAEGKYQVVIEKKHVPECLRRPVLAVAAMAGPERMRRWRVLDFIRVMTEANIVTKKILKVNQESEQATNSLPASNMAYPTGG